MREDHWQVPVNKKRDMGNGILLILRNGWRVFIPKADAGPIRTSRRDEKHTVRAPSSVRIPKAGETVDQFVLIGKDVTAYLFEFKGEVIGSKIMRTRSFEMTRPEMVARPRSRLH